MPDKVIKEELRNSSQHSTVRTIIKKTLKSFQSAEEEAAHLRFQEAVSIIDKAASRGTIHRNKARNVKQRLTRKLKALVSSPEEL